MRKFKWQIVSLAIFVIFGLVVSSFVTGSGPYEEYFTDTSEFDSDDPTVSGSATADIYMAFLDPDGNPILEQDSGLSTLMKEGTTQEVTSWRSELTTLTLEASNVDQDSIEVHLNSYLIWVKTYPDKRSIPQRDLDNDEVLKVSDGSIKFDFVGDSSHFVAVADRPLYGGAARSYVAAVKADLIPAAEQHGMPYKKSDCLWEWEIEVIVKATGTNGVPIQQEDPLGKTMPLITNRKLDPRPPPPGFQTEPILQATGSFGATAMGFIPTTTSGLSITFITVVIFVGIWYKWVRNFKK